MNNQKNIKNNKNHKSHKNHRNHKRHKKLVLIMKVKRTLQNLKFLNQKKNNPQKENKLKVKRRSNEKKVDNLFMIYYFLNNFKKDLKQQKYLKKSLLLGVHLNLR